MRRRLLLMVVLTLVGAACSGRTPAATTSSRPPVTATSTTTTTAITTTAPPQPARPSIVVPTTGAGASPPPPAAEIVGIGDEYFPALGNPGYDVSHYTLDLVFDPEQTSLSGIATITATALSELPTFNLDFSTMTVTAVFVDSVPAGHSAAAEELTIAPATPIPAGEEFVVDVEYFGTPAARQSASVPFGLGWQTVAGQNYVVAEPDAAHSWFPANDHPRDKATFTFRITVPADVIAAANGTLIETITDLGQATWIWELTSPMAPYLATVVIGDFTIVGDDAAGEAAGIPIRHVLPGATTVADWPGLERQGEMVAYFSELFGPFPFDNYGVAIVDGFGAALENQTLSLFDRRIASSAFFEAVLVHELAHQWFGNSVSLGEWKDIWLNEGFASYAEWLWTERESGRAILEAGIESERIQFLGTGLSPPGAPPPSDLFNRSVYRVGAMALHALRLEVGDDAFFAILRSYAAEFADASATTADFIALAEEIAERDLDDLFSSWLYESPVPEFPPSPAP